MDEDRGFDFIGSIITFAMVVVVLQSIVNFVSDGGDNTTENNTLVEQDTVVNTNEELNNTTNVTTNTTNVTISSQQQHWKEVNEKWKKRALERNK